jgi:HAD superfamily hydrolase (TIGR01450 family)
MISSMLDRYDVFLLDVDGVLVRDKQPVYGAAAAFRRLRADKPILILTNNSVRSRVQLASLLSQRGFEVSPREIVTSSYAASRHLGDHYGHVTVWPVGESGLFEELEASGHRIAARPEDAEWVVAGMDRSIDYRRLTDGLRALEAGARLIATNEDCTFPTPDGPMPGAGAIVGAFRGMGFCPELTIGKPGTTMYDIAEELTQARKERMLMVGDRLQTDIAGGNGYGIDTLLVLTGISTKQSIAETGIEPTWVSESLAAALDGHVSSSIV